MSMTPEQREAERVAFHNRFPLPPSGPLVELHNQGERQAGWLARAESAIAERSELQAEIERLRERVSELESSPTIDELEKYRSPMDKAQARPLRELVAEWQARVERSEDREQEIRDRSGNWPLGRRVESDVEQ